MYNWTEGAIDLDQTWLVWLNLEGLLRPPNISNPSSIMSDGFSFTKVKDFDRL